MTLKSTLRELAAQFGLNITRQSENPRHTLVGLRRISFDTIFDVGANEGQFARDARKWFKGAQFYCFEPTPVAFERLQTWCRTDGNALAINTALGEQTGTLEMNLHLEHSPSSSLLATTSLSHELYPMTAKQATVTVPIQRLDECLAKLQIEPKGDVLVKLDVQGYEGAVLRGAPDTLDRTRACIIEVGLDPLYEGQAQFLDVIKLLDAAGLRYAGNMTQTYASDGHVIYLDAVFVR